MNVVHSAAANAMPLAKVPSLIFPSPGETAGTLCAPDDGLMTTLFVDLDRRVRRHQIKQLHDVGVVHAHTTDRSRLAHLGGMRPSSGAHNVPAVSPGEGKM